VLSCVLARDLVLTQIRTTQGIYLTQPHMSTRRVVLHSRSDQCGGAKHVMLDDALSSNVL
jgi:hypothetical protein